MNAPVPGSGGALDPAIAEHLAAVDDLVRRATTQFDRLAQPDERDFEAAAQRARAARAGDLGPDWQRVQQRIDLGRTSLADVFDGSDTSREAERLRGQSSTTLSEGRATAARSGDDPMAEALDELDTLRIRLREISDGMAP
ncbi:MAG TPA: hypothetical protein VGC04_13235 [Cellulomonas sp.]